MSRTHATLSVRQGKVQLEDSSTSGTYVTSHEGDEFFMRRETMILPGSGTISPALRPAEEAAEVIHFNVTKHPTSQWTTQQIVEAFPWDTAPRYLLRDRDNVYGTDFRKRVRSMCIEEVVTASRRPW